MNEERKWDREAVIAIAESLKHKPGALLPVLHKVQQEFGWIPADAVPLIAHSLNLSRAEVHGVVSFYRDFRHQPPGRTVIRVCRAESCQAMGAESLARHITQRLGVDFGDTTSDGAFTLEAVYCLGNCACSPAIMINDELHGRVTAERFEQALANLDDAGK